MKHLLTSAVLAAGFLLATGCSGINASRSVSPATFLLPGLMQVDPPAAPAPVPDPGLAPETGLVLIAQAR